MPTLADIATLLSTPAPAMPERSVRGVGTLEEAGPDELTFVGSDAYVKQLPQSRAVGVIAHRKVHLPANYAGAVFVVDDADLAVARVLQLFAPPVPRPAVGVDALARVAASAEIGEGASIGAFVYVGERSKIGRGAIVHPGVHVSDDVVIGEDCELFPQAVIRERVTLGRRVIINAGSVLGTDGFGYRWDGSRHAKIPQIGTIVVEDDVEIGSCVCIDRAKFGTTRISKGTKIDNLVQVAHNVQIGPHCIITGQVGLAGSVTLGAGVVIGGQAAVRDHVSLGAGVMVAGCSAVAEDADAKTIISGAPALPHRQWLREQGSMRHLPELRNQVKKLQEEVERLKALCEPQES
jgi:UDP-3-O-[3-hydroxymyristoyl] glucosamine N-acyltransferase